ncbi:MAG: T9SS type A sorting domain-containing protein [Saprospiraceae bacterium]
MKKNYFFLMIGMFLFPTVFSAQFSISGKVTRHNGDPVPDIEVSCDGTVTTDVGGNYEFTDVPLNHSCGMTATGFFEKFDGISVLDAAIMRKVVLGIDVLNQYQYWAADVNNSASVTTLDLVKLYPLILHEDDGIPNIWNGIDTDYNFLMPNTNPNEIYISNIMSDIIDADFIAIKRGDVAIDSDHMPAPASAPAPIFTISNEMFQTGDDVLFEITIEDFLDIVGFQQTFKWDPAILEFETISTSAAQGVSAEVSTLELSQGLLPSLVVLPPSNLPDGGLILTLKFKALSDVSSPTEVLSFTDEIIPLQVVWQNPIDNKLFIVGSEYVNGEGITGIANVPSGLDFFQIFPNPVADKLNVKALLQNVEDFEISIINILGQQVFSRNFDQKELLLEIGFSEFPTGTYFLSLKTADGIQTESFVKK